MQSLRRYVRSLNPRLPGEIWKFEAGAVVNVLGTGMIYPFVVIYFNSVRGFSLQVAGLLAATFAAAGFAGTFTGGAVADRVGPRRALIATLLLMGGGYLFFPLIREPWQGFGLMALVGLGFGAFQSAQSTTLATLAGPEHRHAAFSLQFAALNLGLGIGAALGGFIVVADRPATFTVVFLANAASCLAFAVLLTFLPSRTTPKPADGESAPRGRYRDVFRQRALLGIAALTFLFVMGGYALFEVALPVFAKNEAGVSERGIGLIFLVNTLVIVFTQLPMSKLLEGRRRMRAVAVMSVLWATAWLLILATGSMFQAGMAFAGFAVAIALFGVGECILPAQSALAADVAPDELRGRSLALVSGCYALGLTVGPALVGVILSRSPTAVWVAGAAVVLVAGGAALLVERAVPEDLRMVPRRPAPPVAEAPTTA